MEKQIEEMANDIGEVQEAGWKFLNGGYITDVSNQEVSEHLVAKGWRKQSIGEWVRGKTNYRTLFCSKCGYPKPYRKIKAGYHLLDDVSYCPNCGAMMKGGED